MFGADGRRIGRVRYGFRFRKPLDSLVKQYKEWFRSKRPSEPHAADPAFIAVETVSGWGVPPSDGQAVQGVVPLQAPLGATRRGPRLHRCGDGKWMGGAPL